MLVPHDTMIAVADGEKLHLFRATGNDARPNIRPAGHPQVTGSNHSGGARHGSSAANPDEQQDAEDVYAAATVAMLNEAAQANTFDHAVVIAPPKMLGEMRKHYGKSFAAKLLKEIPKDMTGQMLEQIVTTLQHA